MSTIRWLCALTLVFTWLGNAAIAAPASPAPLPQRPGDAPAPSFETSIAAVVNDDVITLGDLLSRLRMLMVSSNLPDTPELRKRLEPQVLRTLIDEKLQMQAAKKKNIVATKSELQKALAQVEAQNHMQSGQLIAYLKAHSIEKSALLDQLTSSIVWAKLVRQLAQRTSPVTDEEVDHEMTRLKEHASDPESRVAEIFLAVDSRSQDQQIHDLAERLIDQMRQGARFSAIAQQFSQSPTAAVGGDLGWVRPQQLPPELAKAVEQMHPGELSPPIRTPAGYYLLLVLDRRTGTIGSEADTAIDIVQVVFPLPTQPNPALRAAAIAQAESIKAAATSCPEMLKIGKEKAPQLSSEGKLRLTQIAPAMRKLVMSLPIGQPSEPIVQRNGVGVIMVCQRSAPGSRLPNRPEVYNLMMRQRLDIIARRYMRDLREAAFVDVRV
ncbi:MAG TPA: peptidylprolyl isomerase [Stellaceae bacterium]|nr:peptidylprolyl isomerase [Stellaceae bacterium]